MLVQVALPAVAVGVKLLHVFGLLDQKCVNEGRVHHALAVLAAVARRVAQPDLAGVARPAAFAETALTPLGFLRSKLHAALVLDVEGALAAPVAVVRALFFLTCIPCP